MIRYHTRDITRLLHRALRLRTPAMRIRKRITGRNDSMLIIRGVRAIYPLADQGGAGGACPTSRPLSTGGGEKRAHWTISAWKWN